MGDQPLIAQAVVQSGLAVSLAPEELTVEALRAGLSKLLASDPEARRRLVAAAETYGAAPRSADLVESVLVAS